MSTETDKNDTDNDGVNFVEFPRLDLRSSGDSFCSSSSGSAEMLVSFANTDVFGVGGGAPGDCDDSVLLSIASQVSSGVVSSSPPLPPSPPPPSAVSKEDSSSHASPLGAASALPTPSVASGSAPDAFADPPPPRLLGAPNNSPRRRTTLSSAAAEASIEMDMARARERVREIEANIEAMNDEERVKEMEMGMTIEAERAKEKAKKVSEAGAGHLPFSLCYFSYFEKKKPV